MDKKFYITTPIYYPSGKFHIGTAYCEVLTDTIKRYKKATLIELRLETGRTHQIRVHMDYIGHAVVNDPVYGNHQLIDETGQCLHAKTLGFVHPTTLKYMEFNCELPKCFLNILDKFAE